MTLELVHFVESLPEIPVNEDERLLLEQETAQRRIGRATLELVEANLEYNDAIAHTIEVNRKIADQHIDTSHLIVRTQNAELFYDDVHGYSTDGSQEKYELAPVIPDNEDERLFLERELSQRRLGRASIELARATKEHQDAVMDGIEISRQLSEQKNNGPYGSPGAELNMIS